MSKSPAVFLDRDGVINAVSIKHGKSYPPEAVDSCVILPGVKESLLELKKAGFQLVVVTNQPDVARGTTSISIIERIHDMLRQELPLDAIYVCYHDNSDNCACRKPKPGMLLKAAVDKHIDLNTSFMVGDRWKDIAAGKAAGVKTVWIRNEYDEKMPDDYDVSAFSLKEALPCIIGCVTFKEEQ
jgi:D-glycero-D-manno-heptose 1,7-bisphosphate phosphatase